MNVDDIPEPTPEELVQLRAEARRMLSRPPGPDEYDALMAGLKRMGKTGGTYPDGLNEEVSRHGICGERRTA